MKYFEIDEYMMSLDTDGKYMRGELNSSEEKGEGEEQDGSVAGASQNQSRPHSFETSETAAALQSSNLNGLYELRVPEMPMPPANAYPHITMLAMPILERLQYKKNEARVIKLQRLLTTSYILYTTNIHAWLYHSTTKRSHHKAK